MFGTRFSERHEKTRGNSILNIKEFLASYINNDLWLIRACSIVSCFSRFTPSGGHLPEMQVQYSSASRSSSEEKVTLDGSGQGVCTSGVTFVPILTPDFVGVHWSREGGKGELVCWARFVLTKQKTSFLNQHYPVIKQYMKHKSILFSLQQLSFLM